VANYVPTAYVFFQGVMCQEIASSQWAKNSVLDGTAQEKVKYTLVDWNIPQPSRYIIIITTAEVLILALIIITAAAYSYM
jgi:hypothetical protein